MEAYLTGLLDATGELKREMYESLRHNKKSDEEKYFEMMEGIYDELLSLRFSNAVLPEFRRKQDVYVSYFKNFSIKFFISSPYDYFFMDIIFF